MANLTRRLILQALPFIGASAAIPAATAAPVERRTPQEQFDHHVEAITALLHQTAGPCDGWNCHLFYHPRLADGVKVRAERLWVVGEMVHGRMLPLDRMREFDPHTGAHTDYHDMPDLANWTPHHV